MTHYCGILGCLKLVNKLVKNSTTIKC